MKIEQRRQGKQGRPGQGKGVGVGVGVSAGVGVGVGVCAGGSRRPLGGG